MVRGADLTLLRPHPRCSARPPAAGRALSARGRTPHRMRRIGSGERFVAFDEPPPSTRSGERREETADLVGIPRTRRAAHPHRLPRPTRYSLPRSGWTGFARRVRGPARITTSRQGRARRCARPAVPGHSARTRRAGSQVTRSAPDDGAEPMTARCRAGHHPVYVIDPRSIPPERIAVDRHQR